MSIATLIALVGPSGAGKTTLARALQAAGFGRIATTTTRAARPGEVVGSDLHVVTRQVFTRLRESNALIATCEYSAACYGVQVRHLCMAAATETPHVIIVEPSGLAALQEFASEAQMRFAAVFVTMPANVVRARLNARYAFPGGADEGKDRLTRAVDEVVRWRHSYAWNLVVDSGNAQRDVAAICELVAAPMQLSSGCAAGISNSFGELHDSVASRR